MIPSPLTLKRWNESEVIVKLLAPGLQTISLTSISERKMEVMPEVAKVATSSGPLGTVSGVQFRASFQLLLIALVFQVALPAYAV